MGLFGKNKIAANDVVNGTFGRVFINGHKFANIKSFEAKLTLEYEEIDIAEDAGKHQKFMGYAGEGTMDLPQSGFFDPRHDEGRLKAGRCARRLMIVGALEDPSKIGAERIQFNEVTLDELTLLKFEMKTVGEEEVPFKFADFEPLDLIA